MRSGSPQVEPCAKRAWVMLALILTATTGTIPAAVEQPGARAEVRVSATIVHGVTLSADGLMSQTAMTQRLPAKNHCSPATEDTRPCQMIVIDLP